MRCGWNNQIVSRLLLLVLSVMNVLYATPSVVAQKTDVAFALNLPEWNPDTADLPPELRPMEIVRPELPDHIRAEVAELETRIGDLDRKGLLADSRAEQDAAFKEAITLAKRVVSIREEFQGNREGVVRWRGLDGTATSWHECVTAGQNLRRLQLCRGLNEHDRVRYASIDGTGARVQQLFARRAYSEALQLTNAELEVFQDCLGKDDQYTITSMANHATLLYSIGQVSESAPYFREGVARASRVLGDDHPITLAARDHMGVVLNAQAKYAQAEVHFRTVLTGRRRVLGDSVPDTALTIGNLGSVLYEQGRLRDAEPFLRGSFAARRRTLGDGHIETLYALNNLGVCLLAQGQYSEAELYLRTAMVADRQLLGSEHPSTLKSLSNYGALLDESGHFAEALHYYRDALDGQRKVLGEGHPDTLATLGNLEVLLAIGGRLEEAEAIARTALEANRRAVGDTHPDTLRSMINLAALIDDQGNASDADLLCRQAVQQCTDVLGPTHPLTLTAIYNMAYLLRDQQKFNESEKLFRESLESRRRTLGKHHPSTLHSMANSAIMLAESGRPAEALPYFEEAISVLEYLRVSAGGGATDRLVLSDKLDVAEISREYANALAVLARPVDSLSAVELGRSRVALDLLGQDEKTLITALQATGDPGRAAKYRAALDAEHAALAALREAEARLAAIEREN